MEAEPLRKLLKQKNCWKNTRYGENKTRAATRGCPLLTSTNSLRLRAGPNLPVKSSSTGWLSGGEQRVPSSPAGLTPGLQGPALGLRRPCSSPQPPSAGQPLPRTSSFPPRGQFLSHLSVFCAVSPFFQHIFPAGSPLRASAGPRRRNVAGHGGGAKPLAPRLRTGSGGRPRGGTAASPWRGSEAAG